MLPNFTVVICGAVLTVIMLAVTGSGLITPETRTRIGEMPEVGRPMMQRMIAEPVGQEQFAVLALSRRAGELDRLRDLVAPVAEPTPAARDDEAAQEASQEAVRETTQEAKQDTNRAADAAEYPDEPVAPAVAAAPAVVPVPAPIIVAAVAPAPPPPAPQEADGGKGGAEPLPAGPRAPAEVDSIEAMIPGAKAGSRSVAALAKAEEVTPTVRLGSQLHVRLPRAQRGHKAAVVVRRPVRHAVRRSHRHVRRAYAVHSSPPNPFGMPATQYR